MSIANEISRIQEARDTLRAKAVALGVGLSTDNLTQLATKYDGIVDRGTPNAEVKEGESVTLSAGYYHGGSIKGVSGGGNYAEYVLRMTLSAGGIAQFDVLAGAVSYSVTTAPNATPTPYYKGRSMFWWPVADTVISAIEMYNTD